MQTTQTTYLLQLSQAVAKTTTLIKSCPMTNFLKNHFQQLDEVLTLTQSLWKPQPFINDELPWFQTHPHLKTALLSLGHEEAIALHDDQQLRKNWFSHLEPELCNKLFAFNPEPVQVKHELVFNRFDQQGISGRKWEQITAFASALPQFDHPLVDWCAGKGHLSRMVQRNQQQPVYCLEWDEALVKDGKALAEKQQLDIRYYQHNVMQPLPPNCADKNYIHIGLHACGDLHRQLLQQTVKTGAQGTVLSPCCYHKINTAEYQPFSQAAKNSPLKLTRPCLHLAVQDPVTARKGERKLRQQERIWRLGFDLLQRELRGVNQYLNIPSSNSKLLRKSFYHFCQWAAAQKNISLNTTIDYDDFLEKGKEKHQTILRLELLRRVFNRPIELWLVLDRALYLQEQGYHVSINQFCDYHISPRNLLIQAQR